MLRLFRRSIARSARKTVSANLRAAADAVQALGDAVATTTTHRRPAGKPKRPKTPKAKPLAKPRKGLAETVAWISAGGMPALPDAARRRPSVPRGASFTTATFSDDHGRRGYKLYIPASAKSPPGGAPARRCRSS